MDVGHLGSAWSIEPDSVPSVVKLSQYLYILISNSLNPLNSCPSRNSLKTKRAHNDYLELLANQGVIGFSLLAMATLLLLRPLSNGLKKGRSKRNKNLCGLQVGSFCSVIAILLHSLADFNFHLPTNAVYFYLILAIGIKIPLLKKRK